MVLICRIIFCLSLLLALPVAAQTTAPPVPAAPQLAASSYVLMDQDSGRLLVAVNPDQQVEPASITKLMTSYVVFHELEAGNLSLEETTTISQNAYSTGGSRMFIEVNNQVSIEDLIRGMVVQSGNDASVALAEHIAGTEAAFADLMNHYAGEMGLTHSHFVNSTGLPDPQHLTTARDVALLSAALIRDFPEYYRWYSEKEFTYNDIRQHNRNTLLWRDPAVDGLKTGHTEAAGYCLAASARRDGMRLVSVVLGADSDDARVTQTQSLLNYGFRFFETFQLYEAGSELEQAEVWKAEEDTVALGLARDLFVTIPRGRYDDLVAQVELQPRLLAPLAAGSPVGTLNVRLDEELVVSTPLTTLSEVAAAGFMGRTVDGMRLWFGGLFGDDDEDDKDDDG